MGKSTTEQKEMSKAKKALNGIGLEALFEFLHEDDEGYSRERRLLEAVYVDALSGSKTSMYSANSLLDRDLGKAKESKDITSGGEKIQGLSSNDLKLALGETIRDENITETAGD